ncbi:MAG: hypothetical protein ACOYIG_06575 [Acetivibrionales bacterium]|jgi:uncharacterized Zn finger protein (UPF0148 family)|nr:zinc ribbon domain-containing protein [Clostridiaceae bacterium]
MSDVKFCDSCGVSLSAGTRFCHSCGKEQIVVVENEIPTTTDENTNQESNGTSPEIESEKSEGANGTDNMYSAINSEVNDENKLVEDISQTEAQPEKPIASEQREQAPVESQPQVTYQPQPQAQQQPSYQQPPIAQQTPYVQQAAPEQPVKKKKFPWFFTILWVAMFAAVGVWAYFIFVHPTYDYPILTEDAQRFVLFTVSIAALIYTLSLKLSVKKLKAIPAILLVVLVLVIFAFFCVVELQEGDFLHDTVGNLVESVIPAFGD